MSSAASAQPIEALNAPFTRRNGRTATPLSSRLMGTTPGWQPSLAATSKFWRSVLATGGVRWLSSMMDIQL